VEKDEKVFVEWLEKAANQNNPLAMDWLGYWFRHEGGNDEEKALSCYWRAAELGWKPSMYCLAKMLEHGYGCEKDVRQAAIWGAKGDRGVFWELLQDAQRAFENGTTEALDCDLRCYLLGWGWFWYHHGTQRRMLLTKEKKAFVNLCLDYYCSCVELQQKSILTFLWFWNRSIGIKGPGQMIAQMVWEQREDNLVKKFEQNSRFREEPEMKRIKK
jgi:hypothetical protein